MKNLIKHKCIRSHGKGYAEYWFDENEIYDVEVVDNDDCYAIIMPSELQKKYPIKYDRDYFYEFFVPYYAKSNHKIKIDSIEVKEIYARYILEKVKKLTTNDIITHIIYDDKECILKYDIYLKGAIDAIDLEYIKNNE